MITEEQMKELIDDDKIIYSENIRKIIDKDYITLFTTIGVPRSVSPGIDFLTEEKGGLKNILALYNEVYWKTSIKQKPTLKNDIVFATYNNDFIVSRNRKEIILVSQDDFDDIYINKDIYKFWDSVYVYNRVVNEIIEGNEEVDYYVEAFTDEIIEKVKKKLISVEGKLTQFWENLLQEIVEEREELLEEL